MTALPVSAAYTIESLRALQELLQSHRGVLWGDPTTNNLAVKQITQPLKEEEQEPS